MGARWPLFPVSRPFGKRGSEAAKVPCASTHAKSERRRLFSLHCGSVGAETVAKSELPVQDVLRGVQKQGASQCLSSEWPRGNSVRGPWLGARRRDRGALLLRDGVPFTRTPSERAARYGAAMHADATLLLLFATESRARSLHGRAGPRGSRSRSSPSRLRASPHREAGVLRISARPSLRGSLSPRLLGVPRERGSHPRARGARGRSRDWYDHLPSCLKLPASLGSRPALAGRMASSSRR
jgi:hypothetical protein